MYTVINTSTVLPATPALHSDFRDLNNEVCHVMKMTVAESNPDMGLLTQQTFRFSLNILATADKIPIMTMSKASDLIRAIMYTES